MDTDAPAPAPAEEEPAAPPDPASLYRADIRSAQASVERFVTSREPRFAQAALKLMACLRKAGFAAASPTQPVLAAAIASAFGPSHPLRERLLAALPPPAAEPEAADAAGAEGKEGGEAKKRPLLPEMELILELLVLLALIDGGKLPVALSLADALLERVASWNRRTLDPFAERAYFYSSWAYEKAGKIEAVRSRLLAAQRTSCLHHNTACQATLLNLLLRSYMSAKLFVQADKLLTKSAFPEQASNGQLARYLYYTGRIKAHQLSRPRTPPRPLPAPLAPQALQLEYSEAHRCLLQAQRKAPQSSSKAVGFKLAAHKLGAIVQLLLGEIPERAVFRASSTRAPMRPYLKLVQAVRTGDLAAFRDAMAEHAAVFAADGNAALVLRLRQNVIRAGLRNVPAPSPTAGRVLSRLRTARRRLLLLRCRWPTAASTSRTPRRSSPSTRRATWSRSLRRRRLTHSCGSPSPARDRRTRPQPEGCDELGDPRRRDRRHHRPRGGRAHLVGQRRHVLDPRAAGASDQTLIHASSFHRHAAGLSFSSSQ